MYSVIESRGNFRLESSSFFNNEFRSFFWFLLILVYIIINVLVGFVGDDDFVFWNY